MNRRLNHFGAADRPRFMGGQVIHRSDERFHRPNRLEAIAVRLQVVKRNRRSVTTGINNTESSTLKTE